MIINKNLIQTIQKMNYIKTILRTMYESVLQDEYIEQLTEQQIYYIISNSQKKITAMQKEVSRFSITEPEINLYQKIDIIGNISIERQFRILGSNPTLEIIAVRIKKLTENLQQIKNIMRDNFHRYENKLEYVIGELDNIQNFEKLMGKSGLGRERIRKLQEATEKSKRIAQLHIKKENIKMVQKSLLEIPNIKKMNLIQLKAIYTEGFKNRLVLKNLHCLFGIDNYIKNEVTKHLTEVLRILQQCTTNQFDQKLYESALRDFIIAQHQTIKYQKLLIKLIQKQIRKIDIQVNGDINQICQFYIKVIINLHGVIRWHRINQLEDKWQQLSKGCHGISIEIDSNSITKKIVEVMDECLKDAIIQKYYHSQYRVASTLEHLYLICRISEIVWTFSGEYFGLTLRETTRYLYRLVMRVKEKAEVELEETLKNQEKNNWNRLPVVDDYSHEIVDKALYQMYRHRIGEDYSKVMDVIQKSKDMLITSKITLPIFCEGTTTSSKQTNYWQSQWLNQPSIQIPLYKIKTKSSSSSTSSQKTPKIVGNGQVHLLLPKQQQQEIFGGSIEQQVQQEQQKQTWEIQPVQFNQVDKYEKYKGEIKLKHHRSDISYTIICQYSLNMLKYIEIFARHAFYYPIEPILSFSLGTITDNLEFYIYNVFNSFLSYNLKYIFLESYDNLETLEQKYHKKRLHYQYPTVTKFIESFNKRVSNQYNNYKRQNQGQQQQQQFGSSSLKQISGSFVGISQIVGSSNSKQGLIVRSRVVALQSFAYLIEYYEHIMKICGFVRSDGGGGRNLEKRDWERQVKGSNRQFGFLGLDEEGVRAGVVIGDIHPQISNKIDEKVILYRILISQLSQLIYTDCIPKLCNLKLTHELIQSIRWSDDQTSIYEYVLTLNKSYSQFFYKMNSTNRGQVPIAIGERLFGVYWKTQLTAIMKAFMRNYRSGRYGGYGGEEGCKYKLEKFIDELYVSINSLVQQKQYLNQPYEKIKTIFPILMQKSWQNTYEMIKYTLDKCQFIFAIEMGMVELSESCCGLGKDELGERKKKIEEVIYKNVREN